MRCGKKPASSFAEPNQWPSIQDPVSDFVIQMVTKCSHSRLHSLFASGRDIRKLTVTKVWNCVSGHWTPCRVLWCRYTPEPWKIFARITAASLLPAAEGFRTSFWHVACSQICFCPCSRVQHFNIVTTLLALRTARPLHGTPSSSDTLIFPCCPPVCLFSYPSHPCRYPSRPCRYPNRPCRYPNRPCRHPNRPFYLRNRPFPVVLFRLFVAYHNLLSFFPHHPNDQVAKSSSFVSLCFPVDSDYDFYWYPCPFLCPRHHRIALRALPLFARHAHLMGLPVSASRADALPARTCRNGSSHPTASAAAGSALSAS